MSNITFTPAKSPDEVASIGNDQVYANVGFKKGWGAETTAKENKFASDLAASYNACSTINPDNPAQAAEAYGEVLEALKSLLRQDRVIVSAIDSGENSALNDIIRSAKSAIERATGKAI